MYSVGRHDIDIDIDSCLGWQKGRGLDVEFPRQDDKQVERDPLATDLDVGDGAPAHTHPPREVGLAHAIPPRTSNQRAELPVERLHRVQHATHAAILCIQADMSALIDKKTRRATLTERASHLYHAR